ncbi:hypothetical protein [Parabacteroides sp.]
MMKDFFTFCMGTFCVSLLLVSCESDLVDPVIQENKQEFLVTKSMDCSTDTIYKDRKFFYEGNTYEYTETLVSDSVIHINNMEVEELLIKFEANPCLVTYMHYDGTFEYFDNQELFNSQVHGIVVRDSMLIQQRRNLGIEPYYTGHDWETLLPPQENKDGQIANLWLFDDHNYDDTYKRIDLINGGDNPKEVNKLKDLDLNDKVTSFVAYVFGRAVLFEMFEDSDFKDHSFSFTVYPGATTKIEGDFSFRLDQSDKYGKFAIPNLKECMVGNEGKLKDSWNDRISSVRLTLK